MTTEELKEQLKSGNITLKQKEMIPTPEDYKMGLMLKEYLNTPIYLEEVPEHLMFTDKDPYSKFRRAKAPLKVRRDRFKALKIAKREDSPVPSLYAERNKELIEEYVKFAALPVAVREEVYGYSTKKAYAEERGIAPRRLVYWDNDDEVIRMIRNQRIKFFDQKTSEILYAFYHKTIQHADANRVNLWLTKVANIKDETIVDNKFTIEWKNAPEVSNVIEMVQDVNSQVIIQNENTN